MKGLGFVRKYVAISILIFSGFVVANNLLASLATVRPAVVRIFDIPQVWEKMFWENGGITLKQVVGLLQILEPEAYDELQALAATLKNTENPDQFILHNIMHNQVRHSHKRSLFELITPGTADNRWFWGEKPDVREAISNIVFSDRIRKELIWENSGLSNERVIQEIKHHYPNIYTLYTQASDMKDEFWLRLMIRSIIHSSQGKKHLGEVFTKRMRDFYGKPTYVYYEGTEPDIARLLIRTIIKDDALWTAMKSDEGATMDMVAEAIRTHQPKLFALYVAGNKGSPILEAVAYGENHTREDAIKRAIRRMQHGLRSVLGKELHRMAAEEGAIIEIIRDENGRTVAYRTTDRWEKI